MKKVQNDFTWCALLPDARTDSSAITTAKVPKNVNSLLEFAKRSRKSRWEVRLRWLDEMVRMGVTISERVIGCPLRVGPFAAFHLIGELTEARFSELQDNAKREADIRISAEGSRGGVQEPAEVHKDFEAILGHPIKDLFLRREIGKTLFEIAEQWSEYSSLSGGFWDVFDVAFEVVKNSTSDESGLAIWDARFKPRKRNEGKRALRKSKRSRSKQGKRTDTKRKRQ
jgi:hypothetical protein